MFPKEIWQNVEDCIRILIKIKEVAGSLKHDNGNSGCLKNYYVPEKVSAAEISQLVRQLFLPVIQLGGYSVDSLNICLVIFLICGILEDATD